MQSKVRCYFWLMIGFYFLALTPWSDLQASSGAISGSASATYPFVGKWFQPGNSCLWAPETFAASTLTVISEEGKREICRLRDIKLDAQKGTYRLKVACPGGAPLSAIITMKNADRMVWKTSRVTVNYERCKSE